MLKADTESPLWAHSQAETLVEPSVARAAVHTALEKRNVAVLSLILLSLLLCLVKLFRVEGEDKDSVVDGLERRAVLLVLLELFPCDGPLVTLKSCEKSDGKVLCGILFLCLFADDVEELFELCDGELW